MKVNCKVCNEELVINGEEGDHVNVYNLDENGNCTIETYMYCQNCETRAEYNFKAKIIKL